MSRFFHASVLLAILMLAHSPLTAQGTLSVFDADIGVFPTVTAKLLALDPNGRPIGGLTADDVVVTENGVSRPVTLMTCDDPAAGRALSITVGIDISSSMLDQLTASSNNPFRLAKDATHALAAHLHFPIDAMAVIPFDNRPWPWLDFTRDAGTIAAFTDDIPLGVLNDFEQQFLHPTAGLLNVAKNGSGDRVAILLTDGGIYSSTATEEYIARSRDSCLKYGIRFYVLVFNDYDGSPPLPLTSFFNASGGGAYPRVTSIEDAESAIQEILKTVRGEERACRIAWRSEEGCPPVRDVVVSIPSRSLTATLRYDLPVRFLPDLSIVPPALNFGDVAPGSTSTLRVTLTARNRPVSISSITTDDPHFTVLDGVPPPGFTLAPGESRAITVGFSPTDPALTFGALIIADDLCAADPVRMVGGRGATAVDLRLVAPNGGEFYDIGSVAPIRWSGVGPAADVRIDYSTDAGGSWSTIASSASGLSHGWVVPPTSSKRCLARIILNGQPRQSPGDLRLVTPHRVQGCAFSPTADLLATVEDDATVRIWSPATGALIRTFPKQSRNVTGLEFSPDGRYLLVPSLESPVRVWDIGSGVTVATLKGIDGSLRSASFSSDGGRIVTAGSDGSVRLWTFPSGRQLWSSMYRYGVNSARFSPDGSRVIISPIVSPTVVVLDATTGMKVPIPPIIPIFNDAQYIEYDRAGTRVLTLSGNRVAELFDAASGTRLLTLADAGGGAILSVRFSPGGRRILTAGKGASLWDATTGAKLWSFDVPGDLLLGGAALSADERRLVTWTFTGDVVVHDLIDSVSTYADISDSLWAIVPAGTVSAGIELEKLTICEGECIAIADHSKGNVEAWQWSFEGGNPSSSTERDPGTICYERGSSHEVRLIAIGAQRADTVTSWINVKPRPPIPSITRCGEMLRASASVPVGYQWNRDGVPIAGAIEDTYFPALAGSYSVTVTVDSSCPSTSSSIPFAPGRESRAEISVPVVEGSPGETIDLPIVFHFTDVDPSQVHLTLRLRFRGSLMIPLDTLAQHLEGSDRVVDLDLYLPGPRDTTIFLRFLPLLGDTISTPIALEEGRIDAYCGDVAVTTSDGAIRLAGLCTDGTVRLTTGMPGAWLKPISPNPVDGPATIEYTLAEDGHTHLALVDMLGGEAIVLVDGEEAPGNHAVSFTRGRLAAGHYLCVLRTSTQTFTRELILP